MCNACPRQLRFGAPGHEHRLHEPACMNEFGCYPAWPWCVRRAPVLLDDWKQLELWTVLQSMLVQQYRLEFCSCLCFRGFPLYLPFWFSRHIQVQQY